MKLFLLEDDLDIIKGLTYTLNQAGYDVLYSTNISDAESNINSDFDLYILDITLPDGNGYDFYKSHLLNKKVIFLTAITDEDMIVNVLEDGALDYITKPFSNRELIARINRLVKNNSIIKVKDITLDINTMIVKNKDQEVILSSLELKILHLLMTNINRIVTRDEIINSIWNWTGNDVYDNTVTVYLKRLREKLGCDIIKTIKGIGYRIGNEE